MEKNRKFFNSMKVAGNYFDFASNYKCLVYTCNRTIIFNCLTDSN